MSGSAKFRAGLIAVGFAAVVFTGSIYGAGLKTQQEWNEERQKFRGTPVEEQIALLEGHRKLLVSERGKWERKLAALEERIHERESKKPES